MKRLGFLLISLVVVLSGCKFDGAYDLPLPGQQVSEEDGYVVTADFTDVVNVVPRTLVMANDVAVGQVLEVERIGWHARVKMRVRKDIVLPANAVADVRQTSLLGEKYIALLEPTDAKPSQAKLADGDLIPLERTNRNPEVEEVLGALSFLLSGGGVGQLKTISHELNEMLDGRDEDIRSMLSRLDTMVTSLDGQRQNIITAMESVNRLAATLNKEKDAIGEALDSMGPALEVLNEQHATLMKMLKELDKLAAVGTRVIKASRDNIVQSLRHLQPALDGLADAGDSLPRGLSLMASFPFPEAAASLVKGDYANALFKMTIDLDQLVNGLSDGETGLPNLLNICSVTPGAALCDQIPPDVLDAICTLDSSNILCPRDAPGSESLPEGLLGTILGGQSAQQKKPGSRKQPGTSAPSNSLDGLLGGLFGGGGR